MERFHIMTFMVLVLIVAVSNAIQILDTLEKSCRVKTDEGNLDLTKLAHSSDPAFSFKISSVPSLTLVLEWNPCKDVSPTVCQNQGPAELFLTSASSTTSSSCEVYGTKADSKFDVVDGSLALIYSDDDSDKFTILFQCSKTGPNDFSMPGDQSDPKAVLKGPGACFSAPAPSPTKSPNGPGGHGLSGGSVLIIIVSVLLVVYLVAGILIMKFVKKAEGTDLIPNRTFWTSIPGYVKDGVLFVVRRGKVSKGDYEDI